MTVQTTSNLSSSIRTLYSGRYVRGAQWARLYDQLAAPVSQVGVEKAARLGNTIQVNFLSYLTPSTSAISETADITPQTFREATATITPTSRGDAIQFSEELTMDVFTDYTAAAFEQVGQNMMESVELLSQAAALQGGLVLRDAARASLDAGTTNCLTEAKMGEASVFLRSLKCPGFNDGAGSSWLSIMHPAPYHDVLRQGNIVSIAQYQQGNIILANELGQIGNFRLVVSPFAKVFGAAGADCATTTLLQSLCATRIAYTRSLTAGRCRWQKPLTPSRASSGKLWVQRLPVWWISSTPSVGSSSGNMVVGLKVG